MASQQGGGYDDNDAYIHGHCACGLLHYRIDVRDIDDVLQLATYCHCARCQRLNGAPYIWSNHWLYRAVEWFPTPANPPPGAPDLPDGETGAFSANMQVYELMKGRKWKLRCRECGSPMGSWNAYKKKYVG